MSGIAAVTRLEIMLRYRAGRWRWLLLSWFLGLLAFSWLLHTVISRSQGYDGDRGEVLFGGLQLFMLALAMAIVPALTSQSINGDRERGRLSILQVTELSAFDIVAGKLLAAWGAACLFVLVSIPITIWAMTEGGLTIFQVVVVTLVMMLLLGIICAIGLGLSAIFARSTTSSVLTYVAVFLLTIGTVILTGFVSVLMTNADGASNGSYPWYLVTPNPFVILADAAPAPQLHRTCFSTGQPPPNATVCQTEIPSGDVLGSIRQGIRNEEDNGSDFSGQPTGGPVWPYGLAFDLLVAGALLFAAVRRTTTPRQRIPRGVRLA